MFRLSTNPNEVCAIELAKLFEESGFGDASYYLDSEDLLKRLFPDGTFSFLLFDNVDRLIATARVMSDDFIASWIADLAVSKDVDQEAALQQLLAAISERFSHTSIYGMAFNHQVKEFASSGVIVRPNLTTVAKAAIAA
ncbi:hypothetical protein N9K16_04200 [Alphaproteobacteria bacterium]|nr:hypothetical protein [Alphaproteobacteria bacterium]